jgi:pilus assembly protein Flp/PilA
MIPRIVRIGCCRLIPGNDAAGATGSPAFLNRISTSLFLTILTCPRHYRAGQGSPAVRTVLAFLADESAATAIEYAIIAVGIAAAISAAVQGIGPKLVTSFSSVSTGLK